MKRIRVALVDEHPVVRQGLTSALETYTSLKVVAAAATVEEAVDLAGQAPEVFVIDATSLGPATGRIRDRSPTAKVVVFASTDSAELVVEAARAGVQGYLLRSAPADELARTIQAVHGGGIRFSESVSGTLVTSFADGQERSSRTRTLTPRERQVLKLVAEGLTSREIATVLRVSVRTVETHREHIAQKLQIHSVAGLTRFAIVQGIVESK